MWYVVWALILIIACSLSIIAGMWIESKDPS